MKIYVDDFYYELEFTDLGTRFWPRARSGKIFGRKGKRKSSSEGKWKRLLLRYRLIKKNKALLFARREKVQRCFEKIFEKERGGQDFSSLLHFESLSKIFPSPFFYFTFLLLHLSSSTTRSLEITNEWKGGISHLKFASLIIIDCPFALLSARILISRFRISSSPFPLSIDDHSTNYSSLSRETLPAPLSFHSVGERMGMALLFPRFQRKVSFRFG